jgi:hypothetical protein
LTRAQTFRRYETPSGDTFTLPKWSHDVADIVEVGLGL